MSAGFQQIIIPLYYYYYYYYCELNRPIDSLAVTQFKPLQETNYKKLATS